MKYGYASHVDSEAWYGPVDTKEEAEKAAAELAEGCGSGAICEAVYPAEEDIAEFFRVDFEELLDRAIQCMEDDGWWSGDLDVDDVFTVGERTEEAFHQVVSDWAKKYVKCRIFTAHNIQEVKLEE